jgi:SnoaL-like protein
VDRPRGPVSREQVGTWLRRYGEAWEARDGEAAARLFAEHGVYHWGPHEPPLEGRDAIRDRWSRATATQAEIHFSHEVLGIDAARAFARWWSTYIHGPGGKREELDGVFVLDFDDDGLCQRLQEWWLARETSPE